MFYGSIDSCGCRMTHEAVADKKYFNWAFLVKQADVLKYVILFLIGMVSCINMFTQKHVYLNH